MRASGTSQINQGDVLLPVLHEWHRNSRQTSTWDCGARGSLLRLLAGHSNQPVRAHPAAGRRRAFHSFVTDGSNARHLRHHWAHGSSPIAARHRMSALLAGYRSECGHGRKSNQQNACYEFGEVPHCVSIVLIAVLAVCDLNHAKGTQPSLCP